MMKKISKIIALVMAVALIALSLCSCQFLDDAKESQVFYNGDNKREILFKDSTYKTIKTGKLNFLIDELPLDVRSYHVTDPSVPALLASAYGAPMSTYHDDIVLVVYDNFSPTYYVRADKYEDIKELIENSLLDHYCINVYHYEEGNPNDWFDDNSWFTNELISEEATAVVKSALSTPKSDRLKYTELSEEAEILTLIVCDKDRFLTDDNTSNITVCRQGADYYVWDGNTYDEYSIIKVSDKDKDALKQLFADFKDSIEYDTISDYFENNYYYDYEDEALDSTTSSGVFL